MTVPSLRDRVRAGKERLNQQQPKPATPRATIRYACGHDGPQGPCPLCRGRISKAKREAKDAKRVKQEAERKERHARREAAGVRHCQRLPHRSTFDVEYNAAKQLWTGTMTIPQEGGGVKTISGEKGKLFGLLASLDLRYRDWLASQFASSQEAQNGTV